MTIGKPQLITILIISIGVLAVIVLLVNSFKKNRDMNQDLVKQLLAAKDSVIAAKNENIVYSERLYEEKERTNEALQQRDSVLNSHYAENEIIYKKLNETLNNIPARINRLSGNADSIIAAFREF